MFNLNKKLLIIEAVSMGVLFPLSYYESWVEPKNVKFSELVKI